MNTLRIAILGAGTGRGQAWLSTLRKLSDLSDLYEFCALCEVIEERAKENAERWHVNGYCALRPMLETEKPDVLLNAVSCDSNVMAAGMAAKYGASLITEIPIAPTLGMADGMIRAMEQAALKLEVTEQVYLWAREQLKRKIIDSGVIGDITHARLWYTNKADYHGINGMRMLVRSPVKRLLGHTGRVPIPSFTGYEGILNTEDVWDAATIEFHNGVVCLYEAPPRGRMTARWDIEGTKGQLVGNDLYVGSISEFTHYPFKEEYTTVDGEKVLDHLRVDTDPPVVFENPYKHYHAADGDEVARVQLLIGFHRAITEGGEPEYGAQNARTDLEILFALRESARQDSAWIDLPLTHTTELEKEIEADFLKLYGHGPEDPEALSTVPYPRGNVRYRVAGWGGYLGRSCVPPASASSDDAERRRSRRRAGARGRARAAVPYEPSSAMRAHFTSRSSLCSA
jgi:predicted dehydrogenase